MKGKKGENRRSLVSFCQQAASPVTLPAMTQVITEGYIFHNTFFQRTRNLGQERLNNLPIGERDKTRLAMVESLWKLGDGRVGLYFTISCFFMCLRFSYNKMRK